ncbi:MAG TPA: phosphatase PAP2 family protein [Candidatus Acidoferrales bacterium]|jgi:undecaprenyl-diphosphatase|nr:phosphatase PAP2 family protein [Candidatus Acidoferrales bacterium]
MIHTRSVRMFIDSRDKRVMRRLHRWRAPRWVRMWMMVATRLGDGWLWCGIGIALLIVGGPRQLAAVESAGAAALSSVLLFLLLKRIIHRPRPCEIEPHCWSQATPPDKFSFPSGHTITAFAITIALGTCYPAFQFPLLVVAASIGLSRIVLGMHYLSDVIAGTFLGSTLGLVFFYVFH